MKKCFDCGAKMNILSKLDPNGVSYNYYHCTNCGEDVLDMKQLHEVAEKYKKMKKYQAKVSKWGLSFGIRLPINVVNKYKLKEKNVFIIEEKEGIRIVPA